MKSIPLSFFLLTAFGGLFASSSLAVLPPRSPESLRENASLIVTGSLVELDTSTTGIGESLNTIHILKVKVDGVEKGGGASVGDEIEIRCWTIKQRPRGWAGPGGHHSIPEKKNDRSRFWLVDGGDGAWKPLEPNGIEPLTNDGDEAADPDEESHPIDVAMERAMEADASTGGQTEAIGNALKKWDASLNESYQKLIRQLDESATDSLRKSQRRWVVWRDLEIESLRAFYSKMHGTMWVPGAAYSEMNLTRQRALTLEKLAGLVEDRGEE